MNTKELKEIESKNLLEINGGYDERKITIVKVIDKICTEIKELITS